MTELLPSEEICAGDWPGPRFRFTDPAVGYPPAVTWFETHGAPEQAQAARLPKNWGEGWDNVWLGVSVETQRWADKRISSLLGIPAKHRFASAEPLLEEVTLTRLRGNLDGRCDLVIDAVSGRSAAAWGGRQTAIFHNDAKNARIHAAIAGGESGPNARPCDSAWLRSLRDQCAVAGVPFFLKQLGGWPDKRAGEKALLDGRLHQEVPW